MKISLALAALMMVTASILTAPAQAAKTISEVMASTVRIVNLDTAGTGSGTVIFSKKVRNSVATYIITNNHVAGRSDELFITKYTPDDLSGFVDGETIATSFEHDLALVAITWDADDEPEVWEPAELADDDIVSMGTQVWSSGFPKGFGPFVDSGYMSEHDYFAEFMGRVYLSSANAIWGNSGGGLYAQGLNGYELIGVVFAIETSTRTAYENKFMMGKPAGYYIIPHEHMSYSIPIHTVRSWLDEIGYGWLVEETND